MDTAGYARFELPGHRVTGDRSHRSSNWMADGTRVGYDFAHAIVDDHSRLAYVALLIDQEIKHLRTKTYRPQTNGKVEPLHQTMAREWAYGITYRSSHHRDHSGTGNRPPISRVHNLREQVN